MLPTDPRLVNASEEELIFLDYYLEKEKSEDHKEMFDSLGRLLGVVWTREDVIDGKGPVGDRLVIPLALSFRSELIEAVKKTFGSADANVPPELRDMEIIELGELPIEEANKLIRTTDEWIKED